MNRQEKIQKIVDEFMGKDYGETVTHAEVGQIIEEKEGSSRYRGIVNQAKKRLVESGKMVENVFGVGYKVVMPDEYTSQSAKKVVSGAKRIDQGVAILRHAPVKDMSADGVRAYNHVNDRIMILQAAVAGAKVEINMLNGERKHPLSVMGKGASV